MLAAVKEEEEELVDKFSLFSHVLDYLSLVCFVDLFYRPKHLI